MEFLFFFVIVIAQALLTGGVLAVGFVILRTVRRLERAEVMQEAILRELSASLINAVLGREDGKERELKHLQIIEGLTSRVADIADPKSVPAGYRQATKAELEAIMDKRAEAAAEMERLGALADPDPDLRPKDEAMLTEGMMRRLARRNKRGTSTAPSDAVEMPMPTMTAPPLGSEG